MGGKREKPEDIVLKLRQVEFLQGQGKPLADAGWHNFSAYSSTSRYYPLKYEVPS